MVMMMIVQAEKLARRRTVESAVGIYLDLKRRMGSRDLSRARQASAVLQIESSEVHMMASHMNGKREREDEEDKNGDDDDCEFTVLTKHSKIPFYPVNWKKVPQALKDLHMLTPIESR